MCEVMSGFEKVASVTEIPPNGRKSIVVDDVPALLVRIGKDFFAVEDVCSHDGQPLTDGPVADGAITCPRHGAKFDLKTGKALCMPATQPIQTFSVQVRDGDVFVGPAGAKLEASAAAGDSSVSAPVAAKTELPVVSASLAVGDQIPTPEPGADDELRLIEALKQVVDPELMVNIIDLGLVYTINRDGKKVFVEMTLTSPACPAGPQIVQQSKMALERLRDVDEAEIKLVMTPPWTPDRMTDEAKDMLGIF
jgi:metal-sulfur cluster biosynthetic enzyme/nitrite reductase/ring-hydroxylating ferredoxin subunit